MSRPPIVAGPRDQDEVMRLAIIIVALIGGFIITAMLIAPSYPALADWYRVNACPQLDKVSTDICAAIRRSETRPL